MRGFEEEGWTLVSHKRGRKRAQAGPPSRPPSSRRNRYTDRRSYATVVKGPKVQEGSYSQNIYRQHGSKPQFFDTRIQKGSVQTKNENKPRSGDPDFGRKTRIMYNVIKMIHHRDKVSGDEMPCTLIHTTHTLTNLIKPASPNSTTRDLIEGNAKNWAYTTTLILRQHYESQLDSELEKLMELPTQGWHDPFEMAVKWARTNLGRRLRQETLVKAEALLTPDSITLPEGVPETRTATLDSSRARDPPQSSRGPQWGPQQSPQQGVQQPIFPIPSGQVTVTALVHRAYTATQATMTDLPPLPQRHKKSGDTAMVPNPCIFHAGDSTRETRSPESVPDVPKTPALDTCLKTATQTVLNLHPKTTVNQSDPPTVPTRRPTRHPTTNRKMGEGSLTVRHKWLIMGDSNLARMPTFQIPDLQIDSYPGATFRNAEAVINKATVSTVVKKVILSFGINNRSQKVKETGNKQILAAVRAAENKFPEAEIWIPEINFSRDLPLEERANLISLNRHIVRCCRAIPALRQSDFQTEQDWVHWTPDTAAAMLEHWRKRLNGKTPQA